MEVWSCYSRSMSTETVTVQPVQRVRGRVRPPGDKSISHRYAMLAAIADGVSTIHGYSTGADCASTLGCLRGLGVQMHEAGRDPVAGIETLITGRGIRGLTAPVDVLDAGNSGSTIRMLAGILAAHPFRASITGDKSLRRRPMRRIIGPLESMGARFASAEDHPPLTIEGSSRLTAIDFEPDVPSAQVKSAVLLAGLHADGVTRVHESLPTRDHTERALQAFGADVVPTGRGVSIAGGQRLHARELVVPGDLSSAVFWMVAAAGSARIRRDYRAGRTQSDPRWGARHLAARWRICRRAGDHDRCHAGEPMGTIVVRHRNSARYACLPSRNTGRHRRTPRVGRTCHAWRRAVGQRSR